VSIKEECGTLDLAEAAQLCRCSKERLGALARSGALPATKIGRRWIFPTRLLQAWIEERSRANVIGKPCGGVRRITVAQALTLNGVARGAGRNN